MIYRTADLVRASQSLAEERDYMSDAMAMRQDYTMPEEPDPSVIEHWEHE